MKVVTSEGVQYLIQAPSGEDLKMWMECITDVIEHMQLENEVWKHYLGCNYAHYESFTTTHTNRRPF